MGALCKDKKKTDFPMAHGNLLERNNKTRQKEQVRILGCVKQTGRSSALSLNKSACFQQVNKSTERLGWATISLSHQSLQT